MVRVAETFDFGDPTQVDLEQLVVRLMRAYTDLAIAINVKPDIIQRETDGLTTDTFLDQGSLNINLLTNKVEMLTNHPSQTTVIWTQLS